MNKKRNKRAAHSARPQQVRIIGGLWRRTPLSVTDAEGLRPTPDRVRETVFNWINHLWDGQWEGKGCLDMFAGTGAFGFEAASRGAQQVTLIENSQPVCRQLEVVKVRLEADQVQVIRGDALALAQGMAAAGQRFDLIFVDPPYREQVLAKALAACAPILAGNGLVYVESSQPLDVLFGENDTDLLEKWEIIRTGRAGIVFYYLLEFLK